MCMYFRRFFFKYESVGQINEYVYHHVSKLFLSENIEKQPFCTVRLEDLKMLIF